MANRKLLILTILLFLVSFAVGGVTAFVTARYISRVEPGSSCVLVSDNRMAEDICKRLRSKTRVYGWPVDARYKLIDPGLPDNSYKLHAIDYSIPVIGLLMDGIFADWVFYGFVSFVVLALPGAILINKRFS